MKVRSMTHPEREYKLPCDQLTDKGIETSPDTRDSYGDPVRPHIVFFGEAVPNFDRATAMVNNADVVVVIGTSLVVYPAASLLQYAREGTKVFYIDPKPATVPSWVTVIARPATEGVAEFIKMLDEL